MSTLLEARGLCAGYDGSSVLRDVNIEVHAGEVVALLGANGSGKTTTLHTLAGVLKPSAGDVMLDGELMTAPLHRRARAGLAYVTEERSVFNILTVAQNLAIGRGCDVDRALSFFEPLRALKDRRCGALSGGEQQMVTLARALGRPTKLLLADELSLGLAPQTVGTLLSAIRRAADEGMGALVVEQHVHRILTIADRVYLLRHGRVEFSGTADEARARIDEIQGSYLGAAPAGSTS